MHHAVFPRGARIRPRLTLAVAAACGEDAPSVSDAAGIAIELMHCASLVHDDLPCFDDADTRRGRPSVHRAFGEPLAVLAGDALIVLAYQTLAHGCRDAAAPPWSTRVDTRPSRGRALRDRRRARPGSASRPPTWRSISARRPARLFAAATVSGAVCGRRPRASRGAHWALPWARHSRSPTTSSTPPPMRRRSASRSARTLAHARPSAVRAIRPRRCHRTISNFWPRPRSTPSPPCRGQSALRSHILKRDAAPDPAGTGPDRGVTNGTAPSPTGRGPG